MLRVMDAGGSFEQRFALPLRENPRRVLLGVRVGYGTALDDLSGPRLGLDVWAPLHVGPVWLGAGISAVASRAKQRVVDAAKVLGRSIPAPTEEGGPKPIVVAPSMWAPIAILIFVLFILGLAMPEGLRVVLAGALAELGV